MTADREGWHVGARVYVVTYPGYNRREKGEWATVTKVGRKWVEYQIDGRWWRNPDDRFDSETMRTDDGRYVSQGRVYLSENDYLATTELHSAWTAFVRVLERSRAPEGTTMEKLGQIKAILGMERNGTGS